MGDWIWSDDATNHHNIYSSCPILFDTTIMHPFQWQQPYVCYHTGWTWLWNKVLWQQVPDLYQYDVKNALIVKDDWRTWSVPLNHASLSIMQGNGAQQTIQFIITSRKNNHVTIAEGYSGSRSSVHSLKKNSWDSIAQLYASASTIKLCNSGWIWLFFSSES